jgi:hypothetical protein
MLWSPRARFELAQKLQRGEKVPLGEVFSFLSGLYFRGKLAYARKFAAPPPGLPGILVITPCLGLVPAEMRVTLKDLKKFSQVPIEESNLKYTRPLAKSIRALATAAPETCHFLLLGSISTPKYVDPLLKGLAERLHFPTDFIGRGDMSRGGLLLRHASSGVELDYAMVAGSNRKGKRPPKLTPRSWGFKLLSGETRV